MANVVVLGGSGFIGTALCRNLINSRHNVVIGDIQKSQAFPDRWRNCNVADLTMLRDTLKDCDTVVNLAAVHSDDVRPKSRYYEVNVGGARNCCVVAEELGIDKIIFTSTVAIYGFADEQVDEGFPPRPFNDYGRSKADAEEIYKAWQAKGEDRSLVILRPTAVFGPGNRGNVYNLLRQIANRRFIMVGDGTNRKSLAYVGNVAACLEYLTQYAPGLHIFNYADTPDLTMNELVILVKKALGQPATVGPRIPYAVGLIIGSVLDLFTLILRRTFPVSRIRIKKFTANSRFTSSSLKKTNFDPPFSLVQGLRETIRHDF